MNKVIGVAAAAAVMLAASAASASTVFHLNSSSGATSIPGGFSKTVDGIELSVTAGHYTDAGVVTEGSKGAKPVIYSEGVGVKYTKTKSNGYKEDDQHTVDGKYDNDIVILAFDHDVIIESITFGYFDSKDDFDFFAGALTAASLSPVAWTIDINTATITLAGIWETAGKIFGIGASGHDDSFKIKKVKVSKYEPPEIPVPAALPLFAAGLAGLGFATRRKKSA